MSRAPRTSWQDFLVLGLLALLTGRELLREFHPPHSRNGRVNGQFDDHQSGAARVAVQEAALPNGVRLPHSSVWPMVLGGGLTLLLFGVVTSHAFIAIGALLLLGAVAGWIGDLLHADAD